MKITLTHATLFALQISGGSASDCWSPWINVINELSSQTRLGNLSDRYENGPTPSPTPSPTPAPTPTPALPLCQGDADTWDAGYGLCATYEEGQGYYNHAWCPHDIHDSLYANQVCPQCDECIVGPTSRRLRASVLAAVAAGANSVTHDRLDQVMENCQGEDYGLDLYYAPGPHFFLGASPKEKNDCPELSFEGMNGESVIYEWGTNLLSDVPEGFKKISLQSTIPLKDAVQSWKMVSPIKNDEYSFGQNNCLHYWAELIRPLGVEKSDALGDFISDCVTSDAGTQLLANRSAGGLMALAAASNGPDELKMYIKELVLTQLNLKVGKDSELRSSDHRSLSHFPATNSDACLDALYAAEIIVMRPMMVIAKPTDPASCHHRLPTFLFETDGQLRLNGFALGEADEVIINSFILSNNGQVVRIAETFPLSDMDRAYSSVSVEVHSDHTNVITAPDPFAEFGRLLHHNSDFAENLELAEAFLAYDPSVVNRIYDDARLLSEALHSALMGMSELAVVEWYSLKSLSAMFPSEEHCDNSSTDCPDGDTGCLCGKASVCYSWKFAECLPQADEVAEAGFRFVAA